MRNPLTYLLAACYRVAYKLHHKLCLRPGKPLAHAQLVIVGSYLAGGAGKTPFTAWLAQFILESSHNAAPRIAILCHSKAKDEAAMLKQQLSGVSQVTVIATPNRYKTAHEIDRDYDYVVCDDGFEDSRLVNTKVIRLDWGEPPTHIADLLPVGKCRSLQQDHDSPALVLRCGTVLADNGTVPTRETQETREAIPADITFTIASIKNAAGAIFDPQKYPQAVAACGIGNPERFRNNLATFGFTPASFIARPDHDKHFEQIINRLITREKTVVITAKDANRLPCKVIHNPCVFIAYQQVNVSKTAQAALKTCLL